MNEGSPPRVGPAHTVANKFAPTASGHRALRRARVSVIGATYFATACAAEREPIFESDTAAEIIFDTLHALETSHGFIQLVACVVMPDHVHVILELREGTVDAVMKRLRGASAQGINEARGTTGSVWQRG